MLGGLAESSGFAEDRKEASDVSLSIEDKSRCKSIKSCTQLLELRWMVLVGLPVIVSDAVNSAIATMTPEEGLESHTDCYVALLESCDVFRVQNVANTGNNVSFFLVYLKHLLSCSCINITEHLYL